MDQRDLDGSPLEPEDLTGDDPSISETPRAGVEEANTSPETTVGTHEGKVSDESSKISRITHGDDTRDEDGEPLTRGS